ATLAFFQRGGAGRMIRHDEIQVAVLQPTPEYFAIALAANRRRALELRRARRDLLGVEGEVVRTRFRGAGYTIRARVTQHRKHFVRRDVDDVNAYAMPPREVRPHVHRLHLRR